MNTAVLAAWVVLLAAAAAQLRPHDRGRRPPAARARRAIAPRPARDDPRAGVVERVRARGRPRVRGIDRLVAMRSARRAAARSRDELADVVDLFVLAVASGLNLRLALLAIASRAPPWWVEPLAAASGRVRAGTRVADALEGLSAVDEHARPLVTVLVSSERYGTPLLPALERLAADARFERRRRAEADARRVPVKLLFPLVLCILPAFGALTVAPLLAGALDALRL